MKRISIDLTDAIELIITNEAKGIFKNRKEHIEFILTDYATKKIIS